MPLKKGDRLRYIGSYDRSVPESAKYGPGTVVGFRRNRTIAIVELDEGDYADWPVCEVRRMRPKR